MKSKKAKEVLARSYDGGHICMENAERAVELAEQEAEMRMQAKAYRIIKEMMDAVFKGDMPQKIAAEFTQKLTEE